MANTVKSSSSTPSDPDLGEQSPASIPGSAPVGWLKVGAIAAASAVVGGLAAAWFFRKTLSQLREAEDQIPDSLGSTTEAGSEEDF